MSQLGIGAMIAWLGGNEESVKALKEAIGKTIASAVLANDELQLKFTDKTGIAFMDQGHSCCESRYMRTDDDLTYYIGATFTGAETKAAPDINRDGEVHEVEFLDVSTSKGTFQMASHNEHNGYYGGFALRVQSLNPSECQ